MTVPDLPWEDRVPAPRSHHANYGWHQSWTTSDELFFIAEMLEKKKTAVLRTLLEHCGTRRWDQGVDALLVRRALESAVYGEGSV